MAHTTNNDFDESSLVRIIAGADEAVKEAAGRVLNAAQRLVPVDTGALRASLAVERRGDAEYAVGSDLAYAAPVEYGYRHYQSGRQIPAQPYLRPALDAAEATE